ncbi:MAG: RES domain-containing protein [Balneolaceae bacterium]|nr:MAG: RES domain-containing protein [Balneolaceae bacterium]
MVVYRITLTKWADSLAGSGFPARWNSKGVYVIYTAESRALACLENLVHRSGEGLNNRFSVIEIDVPDNASVKTVEAESLPDQWHHITSYPVCRKIGDSWAESGSTLLLRVPSSVIRDEHNILINPAHPDFEQTKIRKAIPFRFDERLI